jgi:hypothetical protein
LNPSVVHIIRFQACCTISTIVSFSSTRDFVITHQSFRLIISTLFQLPIKSSHHRKTHGCVSLVVISAFATSTLDVSTSCTLTISTVPLNQLLGVIVNVILSHTVASAYITNHQSALACAVGELHTPIVILHAVTFLNFIATLTLPESVVVKLVVSVQVPDVCSAQFSVIAHHVQTVHPALSLRCVFDNNSLAGLNSQSKSITSTYDFLIAIAFVQYVTQFTQFVVMLGNSANKAHPQSISQSQFNDPL